MNVKKHLPELTLFFDLDGTLYPNENGMWAEIRRRIGTYMTGRMGIPPQEALRLRQHYLTAYGTTLRGLQRHHSVDTDDFLAYVHDLPLERYLAPDPALRRLLRQLQARRWVFTNSDEAHARRVLRFLNLEDCFEGIIDVRALEWMAKPEAEAYRRARALAGNPPAEACVLLDDSPRNTAGARRQGWYTVLIGSQENGGAADETARSLREWLERRAAQVHGGLHDER